MVAFLSKHDSTFAYNRYDLRISSAIRSPRAANRACELRHKKYECDTNLFVCSLARSYCTDGAFLPDQESPTGPPSGDNSALDARTATAPQVRSPAVCLRDHMRFKDRYLPCATNALVKIRQGRRFARAAPRLCGSLEQRRDLGTCPTFISLNAALVACRTSTRRTKQHERR